MRVLLLSDWMTDRGGAEKYIVSLRDALRSKGDDTLLIACSARGIDTTPCDQRVFGSDFPPAQAFLQIANPAAGSSIRKMAQVFRPDVAVVSQFAYHLSPSALTALGAIPTVVMAMDYKTICPLGTRLLPDGANCTDSAGLSCNTNKCVGVAHWLRDVPRYGRIRQAVMRANKVLCPSQWMVDQFTREGLKAQVMPLGVEQPGKDFIHQPAPHPRFVYCGRLSREKGVTVLVRAFAKFVADVPHASLSLVGDGPLRGATERLIAKLGIDRSVSITGWLSPEGVTAQLADAWALVAPSIWAEPFGIAVIEAIMRGVPVIASDSGGFSENVDQNVTGLLIEPGNEPAIVQALRRIAMRTVFPSGGIDPDVVIAARKRFSLGDHADRMRGLFDEITQSARATA